MYTTIKRCHYCGYLNTYDESTDKFAKDEIKCPFCYEDLVSTEYSNPKRTK